MNREQWLNVVKEEATPLFVEHGYPLPSNIRISVGFPKGVRKAVGQCFSSECSGDDTFELFVSPVVEGGEEVAGILVHELCHAAVGTKAGHRGEFKKCAESVGLVGPMIFSTPGPELEEWLQGVVLSAGPYPHATLSPTVTKKDGIRQVKIECPDCGYVCRTTRKWLNVGLPTCCCGREMEEC